MATSMAWAKQFPNFRKYAQGAPGVGDQAKLAPAGACSQCENGQQPCQHCINVACGCSSSLPGEGVQEIVMSMLASPLEKLGARTGATYCANL